MIARVAIDLALDRLFDYEVPEALQEKLAVGQLLSVPFGHREARGFVLAVSSASADGGPTARPPAKPLASTIMSQLESETTTQPPAKPLTSTIASRLESATTTQPPAKSLTLRPINAIVDETPFFTPELLALIKKVAGYTAAPIESVLKAALPAAVLKKDAKPRELLFIDPALAPVCGLSSAAGGGTSSIPTVTKRQQYLANQIARLGGGWMTQLCRELKTTPTMIKELGRLGLVKVSVRQKRRDPFANKRILPSQPLKLNEEQAAALQTAMEHSTHQSPLQDLHSAPSFIPTLLYGVTGSGKTEVYLQAIAKELESGRGAIVMVPEISLTPQTVQRFASRFGNQVAVLHSALSDGERYDEWHRIRSGEARVVVGPRSAVWAPVKKLGLIVVDEEHDQSYKQDENPRYHARDVAVLRGAIEGCKVILGSATPSLESWMNVKKAKYRLAVMRKRAGAGKLPGVRLVDMSENRGGIFSPDLLEAIKLRLERGEQTILFLNRRGYSRSMVCEKCGHVLACPNCSIDDQPMPYTYHQADRCLRCHICGGWIEPPAKCPECGGSVFSYQGIGTQRVEAALKKCFSKAITLRMDADSTSRKNSHDDILSAFGRGDADILVGTQMITKGLDFPNVTLVGVLNADSSLNMPDFRASERTFQLLSQVAGRAGRSELSGEVLIQTYDPYNTVLKRVGNYEEFAENELKVRRECNFPPYCHLASINFQSQDLKLVSDWANMYAASLQKVKGLTVSEAVPSAFEKADGWYRWRVILRSSANSAIVKAWKWIISVRPVPRSIRVAIDTDAVNIV